MQLIEVFFIWKFCDRLIRRVSLTSFGISKNENVTKTIEVFNFLNKEAF